MINEEYLEDSFYEEEVDTQSWESVDPEDLWVFDKLIVARKAGHKCGPAGSNVPKPGNYIIRPVINTFGMGYMARIEHIEHSANNIHPGEFWCEIFEGRHFSIDYEWGKQNLIVQGFKHHRYPLQRFSRWEKVEKNVALPLFLENLGNKYQFINCEFIEDKLIEIHFRRNPDFRWGNSVMIPKWMDEETPSGIVGMRYFQDQPGYPDQREGVFIN